MPPGVNEISADLPEIFVVAIRRELKVASEL
jgi:hypothetical protein